VIRASIQFIQILLLCLSVSSNADELSSRVRSVLPLPIQKLELHQTKIRDAEKLLGKPDLVEEGNYYWAYQGMKYSLSLQFKNGTLSLLQFRPVENAPTLNAFQGLIKEEELKLEFQKARKTELGARLFQKAGVKLQFSPRSDQLEAVELR
jgi:hypothetical protein